jgi:hypothetical protein
MTWYYVMRHPAGTSSTWGMDTIVAVAPSEAAAGSMSSWFAFVAGMMGSNDGFYVVDASLPPGSGPPVTSLTGATRGAVPPRQTPGGFGMPSQRPVPQPVPLAHLSRQPQGGGEWGPTTPGGYPGWKFPPDTPNQPDPPPGESSYIMVSPMPLPTRPSTIHPPSNDAYCYASPTGGGASVPLEAGTNVTIVGYPVVISGTTYYHITWYPNGSGLIPANCLS